MPPLTARLDASGILAARALKASNLADLSRAALADPAEQPFHRERWRRAELHDAPAYVEHFAHAPDQAGGLIVGEIVHRALQWHAPGQRDEDLRERLSCYAWEKGVVGAGARERIVEQALALLRSVLDSRLYAAVAGARQSFRELSFSYETGGRTVHGVIDALVQFADGRWAVIDYKTSWVRPPGSVDVHAHTYLLQVGLYAAAACEQLDTLDVDVYIHYIRHRATVHIPQDRWRAAVTDFERVVGQMLEP
jgi:ATP-dependent exoDNAse (exonuclease V) beta subunit